MGHQLLHGSIDRRLRPRDPTTSFRVTAPSCGSGCSCGWSGGLLAPVRVVNVQGSVGVEGELPAVVVDGVMMTDTQRQQVVEVGDPVVAPPDDVVQFAQIETGGTAGDRA